MLIPSSLMLYRIMQKVLVYQLMLYECRLDVSSVKGITIAGIGRGSSTKTLLQTLL